MILIQAMRPSRLSGLPYGIRVPMDPVGALRRERSELVAFCRDLSDADWQTQSAATPVVVA